ncbi:hypothetical protein VTO42DRAFT_7814 [Malbranchea cinnamomea]
MHGNLVDEDDRAKGAVTGCKATNLPLTSNASATSHTLLPRPVASLVTLFTHSTSLSLRIGTFLGEFAIDSARTTTLTGLELSRAVVEGILVRAGRDVVSRSGDDYGRAEAESLLERSLAALHSTITSASFFASAGFHLSSATLSSFSTFSQNLLATLDATLGSSESSRAIAAFVTLIRREFHKSGAADLGVGDLLVGIVGFALLQRWGRRKTEREIRQRGDEETIWDVVILDNGLRADVVGTQRSEYGRESAGGDHPTTRRPAAFFAPENTEDDGNFEAIERDGKRNAGVVDVGVSLGRLVPHVSLPADQQYQLSDEEIRRYIMNQLPQGSRATIRTDTATSRTITVDLWDDDDLDIAAPPGTAVVEERFNHIPDSGTAVSGHHLPKHSVVFRTVLNQSQTADLRHEPHLSLEAPQTVMEKDRHSSKQSRPSTGCNSTEEHPPIIRAPGGGSLRRSSVHSLSSSSSLSGSETPRGESSSSKNLKRIKGNTKKSGNKQPKITRGLSLPAISASPTRDSLKSGKENRTAGSGPKAIAVKGPNSRTRAKTPVRARETRSTLCDTTSKPLPCVPVTSPNQTNHPTSSARSSCETKTPSGTGYFSLQEEIRESYHAQTDAYSHPSDRRSRSPTLTRSHIRSSSSVTKTKRDGESSLLYSDCSRPTSPTAYRRDSSKSLVPSIYSLADTDSKTSLVLAPRPQRSVFDNQATISILSRDGRVPGLFPSSHLAENIQRFCRFSSASYGSYFLRIMGISSGSAQNWRKEQVDHHEHSSFSDHTGLPASTILLSSHVDPAGGSNSAGENAEGFPLVHFLTLDHDSKAVVLTLRGTWGFEDILTDMTCDYDDLYWMGRPFQVHKGMHASAKRLLMGGGGRVMATIRAALEKFPDYGVIFCGHSLGGGVAALLATLISRPNDPDKPGPMFVTASEHPVANPLLLAPNEGHGPQHQHQPSPYCLPAGRPIHVYAYGPPGSMSPALQRATRGLITTIVNGQDVVPSLSLGNLHDLQAVSLAFKHDMSEAKSYVKSRVWDRITRTIANKFYIHQPPLLVSAGDGVGEDSWAWTTLKSLRKSMNANKLLPPGEVFVVETMRVLQRDAFTTDSQNPDGSPRLGRPATRVQLKYIRDVEARFREIRFGSGMFGDHSPARYEASLTVLARGVLED